MYNISASTGTVKHTYIYTVTEAARLIGLIMITIIRIVHVVMISAEKVLYRNSIGLPEQKVIVSACPHTLQTKTHLSVRSQIILFWNSLIKRTMRPSAKSAVMAVVVVVVMVMQLRLVRFGCLSVFNYLYTIIIICIYFASINRPTWSSQTSLQSASSGIAT